MVYKRIEAFPFCFAGSFSALLQFLILEKSSNNRAHAGGMTLPLQNVSLSKLF